MKYDTGHDGRARVVRGGAGIRGIDRERRDRLTCAQFEEWSHHPVPGVAEDHLQEIREADGGP